VRHEEASIMAKAHKPLFTYRNLPGVKLECTIDLSKLFPDEKDRNEFQTNLKKFCNLQPTVCNIIRESENDLKYQSEQLIPTKKDKRPPVLFVFGNPAIHSIKNNMFFSSEGKNGGEHRFWKSILPKAGIDNLNFKGIIGESERNIRRLQALLQLNYEAPVRIGLCVFISFPSAASGDYSGIQGVKRLFGSKALDELVKYERKRVLAMIKEFVTPDGAVFTFQTDAWNPPIRSSSNSLVSAYGKGFKTVFLRNPPVKLYTYIVKHDREYEFAYYAS